MTDPPVTADQEPTRSILQIAVMPHRHDVNGTAFPSLGRTIEHSRGLIRPLMERARMHPARSLAYLNFLRRSQENPTTNVQLPSDSLVINLEESSSEDPETQPRPSEEPRQHRTNDIDNYLGSIHEMTNHENQNNNSNNSRSTGTLPDWQHLTPQMQGFLRIFARNIPYVTFLLGKGIYDKRLEILNFVIVSLTFLYANKSLRTEITKQQDRSITKLLGILCYIVGCIVFVSLLFNGNIFIPYSSPTNVWDLLLTVIISDYLLKLVTMTIKIIISCLPAKILPLRNRGKYYLMIEATSHVYRCIVPIQPWVYYLYEAYEGWEKCFGIFLIMMYIFFKAVDLIDRLIYFYKSAGTFLSSVNYGATPTEEQIAASNNICSICYEEFSTPVRLQCSHIFCEMCVATWLDRQRSCPLCRKPIVHNPIYRDGGTTYYIQWF